jgi:hypothetical protein
MIIRGSILMIKLNFNPTINTAIDRNGMSWRIGKPTPSCRLH